MNEVLILCAPTDAHFCLPHFVGCRFSPSHELQTTKNERNKKDLTVYTPGSIFYGKVIYLKLSRRHSITKKRVLLGNYSKEAQA
jgi:hypothetical protein